MEDWIVVEMIKNLTIVVQILVQLNVHVQIGMAMENVMLAIIMLSVTLMEETVVVSVSGGYHAFGHEGIVN